MARLRVIRTTTAGIVTDSAPKPGFLGAEGVSIPGFDAHPRRSAMRPLGNERIDTQTIIALRTQSH